MDASYEGKANKNVSRLDFKVHSWHCYFGGIDLIWIHKKETGESGEHDKNKLLGGPNETNDCLVHLGKMSSEFNGIMGGTHSRSEHQNANNVILNS